VPFLVFIIGKICAFCGLKFGESMYILCVISDFGRSVNEICALQGFCY
jgi:hypothetical protein